MAHGIRAQKHNRKMSHEWHMKKQNKRRRAKAQARRKVRRAITVKEDLTC